MCCEESSQDSALSIQPWNEMGERGVRCWNRVSGFGYVELSEVEAPPGQGEREPKASTKCVMQVDEQQQVALILKGSSLAPEGAGGDSKFRGQADRWSAVWNENEPLRRNS